MTTNPTPTTTTTTEPLSAADQATLDAHLAIIAARTAKREECRKGPAEKCAHLAAEYRELTLQLGASYDSLPAHIQAILGTATIAELPRKGLRVMAPLVINGRRAMHLCKLTSPLCEGKWYGVRLVKASNSFGKRRYLIDLATTTPAVAYK